VKPESTAAQPQHEDHFPGSPDEQYLASQAHRASGQGGALWLPMADAEPLFGGGEFRPAT
jgi:hypothetical protein